MNLPTADSLLGKLFHVTSHENWISIMASGAILPNKDGQRDGPFGIRKNGYFRQRDCVSVFDYRDPLAVREHAWKCPPLLGLDQADLTILVLDEAIADDLIPWTRWKEEEAWSEMVVPGVEAGHEGPIGVEMVAEAIQVARRA